MGWLTFRLRRECKILVVVGYIFPEENAEELRPESIHWPQIMGLMHELYPNFSLTSMQKIVNTVNMTTYLLLNNRTTLANYMLLPY